MEKFVPYEKLSKKKKKELDRMKRSDWGGLSPVTRRPENPAAYNRKKVQKPTVWGRDAVPSFFVPFHTPYYAAEPENTGDAHIGPGAEHSEFVICRDIL